MHMYVTHKILQVFLCVFELYINFKFLKYVSLNSIKLIILIKNKNINNK